jgi:amino acid transporter
MQFAPSSEEIKAILLSSIGLLAHENMQVIGGVAVIVILPLVAQQTQSASFVFTHFETSPEATGIRSKPYAVILSVLLSNYCLYGYDTAAHLTEETKGADKTGPAAILSTIGIISVFGWAYYLALTFSIQVCSLLGYFPTGSSFRKMVLC